MSRALALRSLPPDVQAKLLGKRRSAEPTRVLVFLGLLAEQGLPKPHQEYRFDASRRWRFDFAWPAWSLALEIDGGVWTRGRHTRGSGWLKDTEKLNAAACQGWRLLRCMPQQLCSDEMLATIRTALHFYQP